jgi:tetratricopeptide (TPR) repeat protein
VGGHDVFISYARGTAQKNARSLREALVARGATVFLDEREIPYGSEFPQDIANALMSSRAAVVFLDERYVSRPFCIHELQIITGLARTVGAGEEATNHVVVALPEAGDAGLLIPYLPPTIAGRSWPTAAQTSELASLVEQRLQDHPVSLGDGLQALGDDTVRRLRAGGRVPAPATPIETTGVGPPVFYAHGIPDSRASGFIGREHDLWRLFDALVTPRAFGAPVGCTVQGPGGCGKSQLAGEFAWRYGSRYFRGGTVWLNGESGDDELAEQFNQVLTLLRSDPVRGLEMAEDAGDRLQLLQTAVAEALRARRVEPILWIVDAIPEPRRGAAPLALQRWCPAPDAVALLCTSRRAGIEGVPSTIDLGSLTSSAAVTLLTRPPVDAGWLASHEWSELASWVGELPLALSILRDSLTNGFATAKALARSRGQEPVVLVDGLVEALRDEVPDSYLRGIAEAFEMSYAGLAASQGLAEAGHLFARLASSPIHEDLLETLVSPGLTGRLAKRSWIQPTGGASGRRWTMHRIPASFLRTRSADPSGEYARLFTWLGSLVTSMPARLGEHSLDTHVQVIINEFRKNVLAALEPAARSGNPAFQAARAFADAGALAALTDPDLRGLRYQAMGLARDTGAVPGVLSRVGPPAQLDVEGAKSLAYILSAVPDSAEAAAALEQLLMDPRDDVRRTAIMRASDSHFLSVGLVQVWAIMAEMDLETQDALAIAVDWILQPANSQLAELLDSLIDQLTRGAMNERTAAACILHRALIIHPDDSTLVRHKVADIRRSLLATALATADDGLTTKAAAAAGAAFDGADLQDIQRALDTAASQPARDRAIVVLTRYVDSGQRPGVPKVESVSWERDGSLQLQVKLGAGRTVPPAAYEMLVAALRTVSAEALRAQIMSVLAHPDGVGAMAREIGARLDDGDFGDALELASLWVRSSRDLAPLVVNGQWWRAQALEGLGRPAEALAACDAALAAAPADARGIQPLLERRANLRMSAQRFADALLDLDRAIELVPGSFKAHHLRSLCLYNLERHSESQAAAERAIAIDDRIAEAWFFRGIARYAQGDAVGAVEDLERSVVLEPRDERVTSFLGELRAYLER